MGTTRSIAEKIQSKLLKMVLESKEINKQLVIVLCESLIRSCFFF